LSDGRVNIVGVGSILMGDDGAGPAVIAALGRRRLPPEVRLIDAGLALSDTLGTLDPGDRLIVIDGFCAGPDARIPARRDRRAASRAGGTPGSIYRARLPEAALEHNPFAGCVSLHELSVMPALALETLSGREFRDVTVYGIEPQALDWGEGLSAPVARAVEELTTYLCREVGAERVSEMAGESKA